MAQRRMFSPNIVRSDAFLEMPPSSQALYFQLGMGADDDGFVNPRGVMRMVGSSEDDLKLLIAKRFVIPFESGVVVVKHWKMNNLVRKDWYRPTQYTDEAKRLYVKENTAYTLDNSQGKPFVNEPLTQVRLGKVIKDTAKPSASAAFTVEEEKPRKPQEPKNTSKRYQELVEWLRDLTGAPMPVLGKQYAALKRAREADISVTRLKDRAEELMTDAFYRDKGFDWADVVSSFNKRA